MFGYIYETTNLINGKKYIGKRKSNKFLKDYLGSGILIKKAIEKYGRENFTVKLIEEVLGTKDDLNTREQYWINYYNASNNDNFYNISKGGDGGFHSLETNEKIRNTLKGKTYEERFGLERANQVKEKISKANVGKHHSEETKQRLSIAKSGENNPWYGIHGDMHPSYGKHLSEETKRKISTSLKGHKLSEETIRKRSESVRGSKRSEESKARMKAAQNRPEVKKKRSESLKNIQRTEEWKRKIGDYHKGKTLSEETKLLISNKIKGKLKVNNGYENRYINKEELENYLLTGWKRGFIKRHD